MGCYDTVRIQCPCCKAVTELQTKAGDCDPETYTIKRETQDAPLAILASLTNRDDLECIGCARQLTIEVAHTVRLTSQEPEEFL